MAHEGMGGSLAAALLGEGGRVTSSDRFVPAADDGDLGARRRAPASCGRAPGGSGASPRAICHYCRRAVGTRALTLDHVVPLIRGGRSVRANMVAVLQGLQFAEAVVAALGVGRVPRSPRALRIRLEIGGDLDGPLRGLPRTGCAGEAGAGASKGASTAPSEPPQESDCAGTAGARTATLHSSTLALEASISLRHFSDTVLVQSSKVRRRALTSALLAHLLDTGPRLQLWALCGDPRGGGIVVIDNPFPPKRKRT